MHISFSALTHQGLVRTENQDAIYLPENSTSFPCLFLVADGMGGAKGGRTASETAIRIVSSTFLDKAHEIGLEKAIDLAVRTANAEILARAQADESLHGMGTTLVGLAVNDNGTAIILNIGDSRCYFFRGEKMRQISEDHSLVHELWRSGQLNDAQRQGHEMRHVLSRALGAEQDVDVDLFQMDGLMENDIFLLCSDGLHGSTRPEALQSILAPPGDVAAKAHQLLQLALDNGGADNISVVVVRVHFNNVQESQEDVTLHSNDNGAGPPLQDLPTPSSPAAKGLFARLFRR